MFLEREYRWELKMLIFESMRKADEETRRQAEAEGIRAWHREWHREWHSVIARLPGR